MEFVKPLEGNDHEQLINEFLQSVKFKDIPILVVDDDSLSQLLVQDFLQTLGFQNIQTAGDGLEALDRIHEQSYDFIITDIHMPRMNGFDLVQVLRSKAAYRSIPIIAMTGDVTSALAERHLEMGINDYIAKPFRLVDMIWLFRKLYIAQ